MWSVNVIPVDALETTSKPTEVMASSCVRQSSKPFRFLQNGTDAGKKNSIFQNPLAVKGLNFLQ